MQQQQRAASSSSFATTTTKRSSLGSLFLASLGRKNCSKNNNPNSSVACSSRKSHLGAGRDTRNKNIWQQLQLQQNHEAETALALELQQQQQLEEEELQEKASRILQKQHAMGQFLTHDCPTDVLPRIFAYTGPQMTCKLQQCNRFFYNVMNRQGTWRILCEELYKWKPGEPEPACWKEYYRLNPCVPVDFKSILSAVQTVGRGGARPIDDDEGEKNKKHSTNNVEDDCSSSSSSSNHNHAVEIQNGLTVWLRPGRRYVLPRAVTITTIHRTNQVRIETQQLPPESLIVQRQEHHHAAAAILVSRNINDKNYNNNSIDHHRDHCRRHNEPLFRVVRGTLVLRNVNLQHYSPGIDIWNGNAAIQVQPAAEAYLDLSSRWNSHMQTSLDGGGDGEPPPMASAILHQVQVESSSGRGIVTIDGGLLHVQDSYIHDCAATGVYVGGMSSKATLMQTDILNNGTGNQQCSTGGGIARGHSGVYVEQGTCVLDDCSVSRNSASGVCVIAESALDGFNLFHNNNIHIDNNNNMNAESLLTMRKTDVLANECNPLELPPQQQQGQFPNAAAAARREGETNNNNNNNNNNNVFHPQHENNISPGGTPRPRSSILRQAYRKE